MKKIILFAVFCAVSGHAQTPQWKWAKSVQCKGYDQGASVANDASGNTYVTGLFQGTVAVLGTTTLTSLNTGNNYFIAKYDTAGTVLWASTMLGSSNSQGLAIRTDASGTSYVSGSVSGTTSAIGTFSLTSTGIFLAKYNSSGTPIWAKTIAPPLSTFPYKGFGISIDAPGNIYITGSFNSVPPSPLFQDTLILLKYDTSGSLVWKKYAKGNNSNSNWGSWSTSSDASGNSYICGVLSGGTNMRLTTTVITNTTAGYLLFVAKYDNNGTVLWAKTDGGYPSIYQPSISNDAMGNCYVTGHFLGTFASFGGTVLTSAGQDEIFVVKFDNLGNALWAKRGGGSSGDWSKAICNDPQGNIYITGFIHASATFSAVALYGTLNEIFVVKYDAQGNAIWGKSAGGTLGEHGNGISADANGNVYVTGYFDSSYPKFGTIGLGNSDTIQNNSEIWVAKIGVTVPTNTNVNVFLPTLKESRQLKVFPNPSPSEINVVSKMNCVNAVFTIFDRSGKEVKKIGGIYGTEFTITREDLPAGIYFFRLENEGTAIEDKLIIMDK